ncbi:MAG: hypothetical protein VX252_16040 [Myxococcota bacterium]|nr:hypothetical protein [Myxococcota bacterium]
MGIFETFYNSPIQHPILLWVAASLCALYGIRQRGLHPSMRHFLIFLTVLSLCDAWLSSHHIYGYGTLSGTAKSVVPLFFVLAGDFRYLILVTTAQPDGSIRWSARSVVVALALTLVVPLSSQLIMGLLPESQQSSRVLFLVYEIEFWLLTWALILWHPQIKRSPWLKTISNLVLIYYGLWATADAFLLATGSDLGFALRVIPNILYYGGLIAAVGVAAASASRESD